MSSLSSLPLVSCACLCGWMWGLPIQLRCWRRSAPFVFYYVFNFTLFVYYVYLFCACPSLKLSRGVVLFGHMTDE